MLYQWSPRMWGGRRPAHRGGVPTLLLDLALDPVRSEEVVRLLRTELAPWMRHRPGFRSSRWLLTDDRRQCTITVEFDTEPDAVAVAEATAALPDSPARSWHVRRCEVVCDLDLAPRPGVRVEARPPPKST